VLLVSDGRGNLVITRASSARVSTVLQRGVNILAANGKRSHLERFSNYHVLSQTADDPAVLGEATDRGVSRYRPLDILAEEPDDTGAANTRADWEMRTRAGRAVEAEFTVQGWKHMQGLWRHDTAVTVRDPWLDIDGPMYISGVRYTLGAEGTKAVLTTTLRQAFDRIPMPDPSEEPMP
jgi:prophage tail gpP-like protein